VGRLVAIKVLSEAGKDILSRFRNEAIVAGNLRHESIVTVYEFGEHEGNPFLVMEYLEGEDLHQIITSRKPLTLLQKCNIMSQVGEGLHCAHRNGVIHRDVKPANIMVLADGTVKIMDFGIARLTANRDATRLTQQGSVIGTLLYMAPEQFAGAEIDALSDIFAYGVLFYEFLTGKHPFEGADARTLMYKISFEDPPPLRDSVPDCPDALQQVISRLLQKDRELRYQSFKEVQLDCEPIRLEFQQQRAAKLLTQAQDQFAKKQLESAQSLLLEVLDLDPSNRLARTLRENVQKQLQLRTLQPRIEALLKSGEEHLAHRRFSDAVQSFDGALRLDRTNVYIQSRHEHARDLLEHSKRAAALLEQARLEFERENLTSAHKIVSEALGHDPQNTEVTREQATIERAIEHRQRERAADEAIGKAERLVLRNAWDDAIAVLTAVGDVSEFVKVQRLLEWIQTEKLAWEKRQRLKSEMTVATGLFRSRNFAEAAGHLEKLLAEFPDNEEVSQLYFSTRRSWRQRPRLTN
jgi:serine/threonine-protein kinase